MGYAGLMHLKNTVHTRRSTTVGSDGVIWVFARIMMGLAAQEPDNSTISIDATYLKAHRTASSLWVKKGGVDA